MIAVLVAVAILYALVAVAVFVAMAGWSHPVGWRRTGFAEKSRSDRVFIARLSALWLPMLVRLVVAERRARRA